MAACGTSLARKALAPQAERSRATMPANGQPTTAGVRHTRPAAHQVLCVPRVIEASCQAPHSAAIATWRGRWGVLRAHWLRTRLGLFDPVRTCRSACLQSQLSHGLQCCRSLCAIKGTRSTAKRSVCGAHCARLQPHSGEASARIPTHVAVRCHIDSLRAVRVNCVDDLHLRQSALRHELPLQRAWGKCSQRRP
jgi:hypothetical protein